MAYPASTRQIQGGHRLGPYEIISAIGAGGMGEVWRAKRDSVALPLSPGGSRVAAVYPYPDAAAKQADVIELIVNWVSATGASREN